MEQHERGLWQFLKRTEDGAEAALRRVKTETTRL